MSSADPDQTAHDERSRSSFRPRPVPEWLMVAVPTAALLIGLLIGSLVAGAGNGGGTEPAATVTVTASPSGAGTADTAVVVPQECLKAAGTIRDATTLLRRNVSAIQDFDADRVVDVLNQLEDLTNQADAQASTCSDVDVQPTVTASATP